MTGAHEVTQAVAVAEDGQLEQAPEALLHLRAAVRAGVPWHQALLQAVGLWTAPEEVYQDRTYLYLIQGEAFDWLVLAERLCVELDGYIPAEDRELLLFQGKLPEEVTPENFKELLGANKYSGYLNYCYGIVVEEALQLAVEEEVRKRHRARGYSDSEDFVEEAFTLLYGDTQNGPAGPVSQEGTPAPAPHHDPGQREAIHLLAVQAPRQHVGPGAGCQRHPQRPATPEVAGA